MSQITAMLSQLKKVLKAKGVTYKHISEQLLLSESSIKRIFSKKNMSLDRLESICEMVDIEFADLLEMAKENELATESLPYSHEKELVDNPKMLLTAHLLLNKWSVPQILANYTIAVSEMTQLLSRLDKMKIIEYLPNERVRMKVSRHFHWLKQGPIEQFFKQNIETEFFNCQFNGPGEIKLFSSGMLSRSANAEMQKKIKTLNNHFNELHKQDEKISLDEKFGTSICVAMRPWDIQIFANLRKPQTLKTF